MRHGDEEKLVAGEGLDWHLEHGEEIVHPPGVAAAAEGGRR